MATEDLKVRIGADVRGFNAALAQVQNKTKAFATGASRSFDSLKNSVLSVKTAVIALAGAYATVKVAQQIKESALLAARYETLGIVMETVGKNVGYTADEMHRFAKGVEAQGITMNASRLIVTRLAQAQLDLSQSTRLARIAQDAAVIGMINSTEAFERMIHGIISGNVLILRNIGIQVQFEEAYKKGAKALGKTTEELTAVEKTQLRMNEVMKAGENIAGTYVNAMETVGKKWTSFVRYVENFWTKFGSIFNESFGLIVDTATLFMKNLNKSIDDMGKSGELEKWAHRTTLAILSFVQESIKALKFLGDAIVSLIFSWSKWVEFVNKGAAITLRAYASITEAYAKLVKLIAYATGNMTLLGHAQDALVGVEKIRSWADTYEGIGELYAKQAEDAWAAYGDIINALDSAEDKVKELYKEASDRAWLNKQSAAWEAYSSVVENTVKKIENEVNKIDPLFDPVERAKQWKDLIERMKQMAQAEAPSLGIVTEEEAKKELELNEKLIKERLEAQKEANDKLLKEQEHFYERMHDATADWTYEILDGQIRSWGDAWSKIMDIVKHAIAEMVAYAIARPIVVPIVASMMGAAGLGGLVPSGVGGAVQTAGLLGTAGKYISKVPGMSWLAGGLGGVSQFLSSPILTTSVAPGLAGAAAPGIAGWGAASWGSVLGAGGLGYLGADLLFGGKGQSALGGGLGAALGMFSPLGPLGAVIGGLGGGFLGSLFGAEKPHKFRAQYGFDPLGNITGSTWGRGSYPSLYTGVQQQLQATYGGQMQQVQSYIDVIRQMSGRRGGAGVDLPSIILRTRDFENAGKQAVEKMGKAMEKYMVDVAKDMGFATVEAFVEYAQKMEERAQASAALIGSAFADIVETGDWGSFIRQMKNSLYTNVKEAVIASFMESAAFRTALAPFYQALERGLGGKKFSEQRFWRYMTPALEDLDKMLGTLQPMFNQVNQLLIGVSQAMPYQSGGYVPSKRFAILHPSEGVLNKMATESVGGREGIRALNQGTVAPTSIQMQSMPIRVSVELDGDVIGEKLVDAARDGRWKYGSVRRRGVVSL